MTAAPDPPTSPSPPPFRSGPRFLLPFTLVALVVGLLGHREYRGFEDHLIADRQAQLAAVAELKAEWIAQWRRERIGDATAMGVSSALAELLALPAETAPVALRAAAERRLASVAAYRQYRAVYVLDATGRVRLSWPAGLPAPPWLGAVFSQLADERVPTLHDDLDAGDVPRFTATALVEPQPSSGGEAPALGAVMLEVDTEASLGPFLSRWPTALRTAENHLVRRDGPDVVFLEVASRTGPTLHGRRVPLTRSDVLAVRAATGAEGAQVGIEVTGLPVMGAIRQIPEAGWAVVTHMDAAELRADLHDRLATVVAFIALVMVAFGALLALALRVAARRFARRHGILVDVLAVKTSALDDLVARSPVVVYGMVLVEGRPRAARMTANIERVLGYPVAEATQPDWWPSSVHPEDLHFGAQAFERLAKSDVVEFEYRFRHRDGRWRWMRDRLEVTRRVEGQAVEFAGALEDVTERRATERDLWDSEERLRMALAAGQQGLFDLDVPSGDVVVSAGFATMLGHDPETFRLTYESWLASLHPDDVERVQRIVAEYLAGALGEVYHAVFRMRTASGDYRWISSTGRLLTRDDQGRPLRMLGTHTDITSHKAAQLDAQRLAHLYAALSASSEAVGRHAQVEPLLQAVCDAAVHAGGFDMAWAGLYEAETGDIRRVAQAGPALDYLNGLHLSTRPDDPTSIGPAAQSILTNAPAGFDDVAAAAFDAHWRTRALSHGWRSILGFPLRRGGRPVGSLVLYARAPDAFDEASRRLLGQMAENVSFALDALERDRRRLAAEGEVRRSLNEREALLKEIHHRVKNNLQVITSLLRLEANRADTPEVRGVLVEMKNRVLSMALLHELLYRSDTLASVNLATYLSELGRQVFEVSALHAGIRLETALAPVQVDLDQAVPCGLLVNELLANALKHGFPDGRRGTVALTVSCDESTGTISLTVADDGVGLAPDFETRRQRSLGLQMVADLTRQLDGRLQIDAPSGARFRVTFQRRGTPATPPRPSRPPEALPVPEAFPSRRRDPANQ